MKLLAFDTSTDACSVALLINGEIHTDHRIEPQQQSRLLLPMIDALMADAELRPSNLDGLVYGRGPGSFTGVRIAVAAAQGIAFGADIGVYGVSTLHNIAQGCHREFGDRTVNVAIDARMSEVYFARFGLTEEQNGVSVICSMDEERLESPEKLLDTVGSSPDVALAGSGYDLYLTDHASLTPDQVHRELCLPSAHDCLSLARNPFLEGRFSPAETASPVYLRNQVARTEAERALKSS